LQINVLCLEEHNLECHENIIVTPVYKENNLECHENITVTPVYKDHKQIEQELKLEIRLYKFQVDFYINIIRTMTDIPIDTIIKSKKDGIHIYNYKDGVIPLIVHDTVKDDNHFTITTKEIKNVKKRYRTVKNKIDLVEEDIKVQVNEIPVNENVDDVSKEDIEKEIDIIFTTLETSKQYNKHLFKICSLRSDLLGKINLENYTELVSSHVERLKVVLCKLQGKKLATTISKSLSPLDARLIFYNDYYNTSASPEDFGRLQLGLDIMTIHPKKYVLFDREKTYNQFYNYGLCLFTMESFLKRIFFNRYGYYNIIYVPFPKSLISDPYSFYTLGKVDKKGNRHWNMECRLENLCQDFISNIRNHCISIFKRIYKDIFNDNKYRENFQQHCRILSEDCEQLLQNIAVVSSPISFRNMIKQMVIDNATMNPSDLDKFHLTGDDKLQQRRLKDEMQKDENDFESVAKQIFEDISKEQIDSLWVNRKI
jgi:hypothetical protein